ncbi:protein of unknown function [Methylocella tundrae]|uniref:Uncharacterized protein n=1 Tax=Methylocella tundrae TaxID=227605 RepID=A0A4U8Z1P0_METTU|nr:protein of unknown function [Methylocella tundrae]
MTRPQIVSEQLSSDGTRKWLIRLAPSNARDRAAEVECVYIPDTDRGTLCVSSQVGCTLTCSFCHTGTQQFVRNLTAQEIIAQLIIARERLGDFPGPSAAAGWDRAERRLALCLEHRLHGDGRAAL